MLFLHTHYSLKNLNIVKNQRKNPDYVFTYLKVKRKFAKS